MPGRILFNTSPDGGSVLTEAMRITSAGNVGIGTTSPAAQLDVSGSIFPSGDGFHDLGSLSKQWRNIYTADFHLNNTRREEGNEIDGTKGDWTIQEGKEDLYLLNNETGKKYKFNITEIE